MRRKRGRPSPDKKRIARLESLLFASESAACRLAHENDALRSQLSAARKAALAGRWQLHRLQSVLFAANPVNESPYTP